MPGIVFTPESKYHLHLGDPIPGDLGIQFLILSGPHLVCYSGNFSKQLECLEKNAIPFLAIQFWFRKHAIRAVYIDYIPYKRNVGKTFSKVGLSIMKLMIKNQRAGRKSCIEILNGKDDKKWPSFMHLYDLNSPFNISRCLNNIVSSSSTGIEGEGLELCVNNVDWG
ncbi:hypothetical protein DVH24_011508 [Malus domestica]|uniref:Uncharacterized protein n=1 Tax=Malus domestica TaxID=3750 RepID=A0A498JYU4_MALDO|nr:hypothetical protein DVH24_011508 [Malus domestica]